MKCKKCGVELSENAKVCENCGNLIEENNKNEKTRMDPNKLCVISIAFIMIPIILIMVIMYLADYFPFFLGANDSVYITMSALFGGISAIIAVTIMIYVRVKYPKNKFGKVLMYTYIYFLLF